MQIVKKKIAREPSNKVYMALYGIQITTKHT